MMTLYTQAASIISDLFKAVLMTSSVSALEVYIHQGVGAIYCPGYFALCHQPDVISRLVINSIVNVALAGTISIEDCA
jgi:hypothetical protein